jgi:exonuclease SbcD
MRFLCFADVHLGAGAEYGTSAYGPGSRLADQESILGQLADRVRREQPDAVLFAGDAFHRRKPTPAENEMWRRFLQHVSRMVPVVMIPGNHDVSQAGVPNALTPFGLGIDNVVLMSEPGIVALPLGRGEAAMPPSSPQAFIVCVPWWPMSHFAHVHPDVEVDALHTKAAETLHDFIDSVILRIATAGGDGVPVIVLTHYSVSGAVTPTGADVSGFRELVLDERRLEYSGADAVVLGHIHGFQPLEAQKDEPNVPVFYCGSANVVDFGEADISHGYVMLDTDPLHIEFQSLLDRRFVTLDYDLRDGAMPTVERAIVDGAVVRARVKLGAGQTLNQAELRRQIIDAGAHKVYAVQVDIERVERPSADVDEDTDSRKAFDTYLRRQEIADDLRQGAGARHAHYMEEEA